MKNNNPRALSFSLRLTVEERLRLEREAGGITLGAYIRSRLFSSGQSYQRRCGKRPVKDWKELARLLAWLGQSRIANNLNQLAKAANSGSLPVCPEVEHAILQAYEDVACIRRTLIEALFVQPENKP